MSRTWRAWRRWLRTRSGVSEGLIIALTVLGYVSSVPSLSNELPLSNRVHIAPISSPYQLIPSVQHLTPWIHQIGVQAPADIASASLDEFSRFFNINVKGTLLCVRTVSRQMRTQEAQTYASRPDLQAQDRGRGVIINLGSCNSYVATPNIVQYTASKHAVLGLTRNAGISFPAHIRHDAASISPILLLNNPMSLTPPSPRQRPVRHPRQRNLPFLG